MFMKEILSITESQQKGLLVSSYILVWFVMHIGRTKLC